MLSKSVEVIVPSVMLDEVTVLLAMSVPVTVPSIILDELTESAARSVLVMVPSTISAESMSVPRVALIWVPGVIVMPVPAV